MARNQKISTSTILAIFQLKKSKIDFLIFFEKCGERERERERQECHKKVSIMENCGFL